MSDQSTAPPILKRNFLSIGRLRRLRWWELALAVLPFLLALSQVGYFATKPFHATFGVVLGLLVGSAGFALNVTFAQTRWRVLLKVGAMLVVLMGCFVAVETIAVGLGAVLPAGFFDR
jgi:uncharacterized protein YybS (DUF2232 family)